MRRVAALFLVLLAVAPALAQPSQGPTITLVKQPAFSIGDTWSYVQTVMLTGGGTQTANQTLTVAGMDTWNGTPAYRVFSQARGVTPAAANDPTRTATEYLENKTTWLSVDGIKTLHIEQQADKNQFSPYYFLQTRTVTNWTFHEPQDVYQFPLVQDDAWISVLNVTRVANITFFSAGPNATGVFETGSSYGPERTTNTYDRAGNKWLRVERNVTTGAGKFDAVIVQTNSGNTTIFDFWAPPVGNIVRREIVNPQGELAETLVLTAYKFARPPETIAPRPPPEAQSGFLEQVGPFVAVAAVGVVIGLGVVARQRRRAVGQTGEVHRPGGEAPPAEVPAPPSGVERGPPSP